MAEGLKKNG